MTLYDVANTPIVRHIKVKGTSSSDDPELHEDWEKRRTKTGKNHKAQGSKKDKLAKEQNWKCPVCGEHLFNGEMIEINHIVCVKDGGTDDTENLSHVHKICHKQVHSQSKLKA